MSVDSTPTMRWHHLTFVRDGNQVVVGRPDTGSYGVFPPQGAELIQRLQTGLPWSEVASWWQRRTGESLDVEDFGATVSSLGFLTTGGEAAVGPPQVRWQRLGRACFAAPAWMAYFLVMGLGLAAMLVDPTSRPGYRQLFFTDHLTLVTLVLAFGQFPMVLLHEAFHALAARRLGLPSSLGVGRRYYYLVAETHLDALYSVSRRQRFLPLLSGSLIDAVGVSLLTIAATLGHRLGAPSWLTGLALAFATTGVLRILWEGLFYLETDFYFAINTVTGCHDLHGASRFLFRHILAKALRHRPQATSEETSQEYDAWSDHDHRVARYYAPLMIVGYAISTFTLLTVAAPSAWRFWTITLDRFVHANRHSGVELLDASVFALITLGQLVLMGYVLVRDRRAKTTRPAKPNSSS